MEFDYQMIKDREMQQREALIRSLPISQPQRAPGIYINQQPPASRVPPLKPPRRSLKCRPKPQGEVGLPSQPANSRESETVVQRVSPAVSLCGAPICLEPLSPSLRAHTLLWFQRTQLPRLHTPGQPLPSWLHGFATRREAEELLKDEGQGCFLVRLSESKIGFVLSYRGKDRCRHFIIEEEGGGAAAGGGCYLIAGEESCHDSLQNLVSYYTQHPVGPFDEMLTTPCVKAKQGNENLIVQEARGRGAGRDSTSGGEGPEQQPSVAPSAPQAPAATPCPPGGSDAPPTETAQYAVVRKVLKKARSLPESQTGPDSEVPNFIPIPPSESPAAPDSISAGAVGGENAPDAQYARVNKPPRTFANTPPSAADDPQIPPTLSCRGSTGEQKYWELVPMHTYEETNHLTPQSDSHDQIDFYAMGRRRDVGESTAIQNHLYSEVNLRGSREASAPVPIPPPARTAPGLPLRPPPRIPDSPSQVESVLQRLDGRLPLTPPSRSGLHLPASSERPLPDNHTSIYEQIPERGCLPRPPLPPQNYKH